MRSKYGGRTWWLAGRSSRWSAFALRASVNSLRGSRERRLGHLRFTRINITPTILYKKIEDLRNLPGLRVGESPAQGAPLERARGLDLGKGRVCLSRAAVERSST